MLRINNTLAILLILLTGALANPLRRRGTYDEMACVPRGSCYDAKTHAIGLKDVHEHEHDKEVHKDDPRYDIMKHDNSYAGDDYKDHEYQNKDHKNDGRKARYHRRKDDDREYGREGYNRRFYPRKHDRSYEQDLNRGHKRDEYGYKPRFKVDHPEYKHDEYKHDEYKRPEFKKDEYKHDEYKPEYKHKRLEGNDDEDRDDDHDGDEHGYEHNGDQYQEPEGPEDKVEDPQNDEETSENKDDHNESKEPEYKKEDKPDDKQPEEEKHEGDHEHKPEYKSSKPEDKKYKLDEHAKLYAEEAKTSHKKENYNNESNDAYYKKIDMNYGKSESKKESKKN